MSQQVCSSTIRPIERPAPPAGPWVSRRECGNQKARIPRPGAARAMSLLETMLALSLMSIVSVAAAMAVRTSWQVLDTHGQRSERLQHLSGVLSHVTRNLRTARSIVAVSGAADTSGYLAITLADDSVVKWDHDDADLEVLFGPDPPSDLLATGIDSLRFECFEVDGVTPTTVVGDIRMIRTTASVTVPVQGVPFALTTAVWLRKQQDELVPEFNDFHASNSSTPIGWQDHGNLIGPPDGLLSSGAAGATVKAFGFDTTGYTGPVGTVLVGFCLKTGTLIGQDVMDVQLDRGSLGPTHSFAQPALLRFENNLDWFWVDVTNDFASWTYEDLTSTRVQVTNRDAGVGGTTIRLDSVKIRTFEEAPVTQTFWLTGQGYWNDEWRDTSGALGSPDGIYARSNLTFDNDADRKAYFHAGSWQDQGMIVRVRLVVFNFYLDVPFVDDRVHIRFPSPTESQEPNDSPAPNSAEEVPLSVLNDHVGSANPGTISFDFTNVQAWTWPDLNSRYVRLYGTAIGIPDGGDVKVDAVGVEVRHVPPSEAALVLWEEL